MDDRAKALIAAGDRYERARYAVEDIMEKNGIRTPTSSRLLAALRERSLAKQHHEECRLEFSKILSNKT